MAEHGFFVREMNSGWAEWVAAGLPTHSDEHLPVGAIRCSCSLHAELVPSSRGPAAPDEPSQPAAP